MITMSPGESVGTQNLFDIGEEAPAVDRSVEHEGGGVAAAAEDGQAQSYRPPPAFGIGELVATQSIAAIVVISVLVRMPQLDQRSGAPKIDVVTRFWPE